LASSFIGLRRCERGQGGTVGFSRFRQGYGQGAFDVLERHLGGRDFDGGLVGVEPPLTAGESHPATKLENVPRQVELDLGSLGVDAANVGGDPPEPLAQVTRGASS